MVAEFFAEEETVGVLLVYVVLADEWEVRVFFGVDYPGGAVFLPATVER